MAKVKPCQDRNTKKPNGNYYFRCPATNRQIEVSTKTAWSPLQIVYGFNGDINSPSFTPAIKIVNGKDVGKAEPVSTSDATVNHFSIQDGNIRYFDDCTHHLKGRTVPLPDLK